MKKNETKPSEAENVQEKVVELTPDEKLNQLIPEFGPRCQVVDINPNYPMCVVGNRTNILHNRGVMKVLLIKEME